MECGDKWPRESSSQNGREEYRVHAGACAESAKKKLNGDVLEREITKVDIERYKAIHEKFVRIKKDIDPTE